MKLNERQYELLHILSLRPSGAVIRSDELMQALYSLTPTGLVSDVYDMPSSGTFGRITEAGRTALKEQEQGR